MQHLVVIGDNLQQHFGGEILDIFRLERHAALMGGEVNDVVDQAEVTIDKIVPRPAVMLQAALEQSSIDSRERHTTPADWGFDASILMSCAVRGSNPATRQYYSTSENVGGIVRLRDW